MVVHLDGCDRLGRAQIEGGTLTEFLRELFEFEYCAECGGDTRDHDEVAGPFGLPFARCKYPPAESGAMIAYHRGLRGATVPCAVFGCGRDGVARDPRRGARDARAIYYLCALHYPSRYVCGACGATGWQPGLLAAELPRGWSAVMGAELWCGACFDGENDGCDRQGMADRVEGSNYCAECGEDL